LSINLSIDNVTLKNSTIRVLSLVPANKLLVLVGTPVFTTIFKLDVTLNSFVGSPGTSVNISVCIVESTFTLKSISFPLTMILVAISVVALTIAFGLTLHEFSLVDVIGLENLLSVSCSEAVLPVTVVVTASLVSELALTVVEVVLESSFIEVAVVLPALALAIALSVKILGLSNITIVVGHLTPTSHSTVEELTNVGFLVLTSLESV